MARLPHPGGDEGNWGTVLNDFLSQAHKTDGSLKPISTAQLADGSVTQAKLQVGGSAAAGKVLSTDGNGLSWTTVSGGGSSAPSGPAGGDLDGTYPNPTVPGLASKANAADVYTKTQVDAAVNVKADTADVYTKTQVDSALADKVDTSDARLSDNRTPKDSSVTGSKLSVSNTPTNGQLLSYNGGNFTWVTAPSGTGGTDPLMGGDLTGNASDAQIATGAVGSTELADEAVVESKLAVSNSPADGKVLGYSGSAMSWVDQSPGDTDPTVGGDLSGTASNATIKDGAVTTAKVADGAISETKLDISNSPSSDQVLSWNGSALAWSTPASGGGGNNLSITHLTDADAPFNTTTFVATPGTYYVCDATDGGLQINLPQPTTNGAWVTVKKTDDSVNSCRVKPLNGVKIDESTTVEVNNQWMAADFISDGTNWYRVG